MPRVKILPYELKGLGADAEAHITAELRKPLTDRKPRAKRGTGATSRRKLAKLAGGSPLEAIMRGMILELDDREPLVGWSRAAIEFRFDPERQWRFDFAWPDHNVAVELEGGNWGTGKACPMCHRRQTGRHNTGKGFEDDAEKYNRAAALGWTVLRYTAGMLRRPDPLADLRTALKARSR